MPRNPAAHLTLTTPLLSAATAWLREARPANTELRDHDGPPPKLSAGEDVQAAIARIRERGKKLASELARLRKAGLPSSECKRRMRLQIEELAQRGAPSVTPLCRYGREITWPTQLASSQVFAAKAPTIASTEVVDSAALLAFALKDSLINQLDAMIDAETDDKNALAPAAREKREAALLRTSSPTIVQKVGSSYRRRTKVCPSSTASTSGQELCSSWRS